MTLGGSIDMSPPRIVLLAVNTAMVLQIRTGIDAAHTHPRRTVRDGPRYPLDAPLLRV